MYLLKPDERYRTGDGHTVYGNGDGDGGGGGYAYEDLLGDRYGDGIGYGWGWSDGGGNGLGQGIREITTEHLIVSVAAREGIRA